MSRKEKFTLSPPSLIEHLQSILKQYPPDGQILKELIQNADDAGATEVKFLLDCTQHGTDPQQFQHSDMIEHQGPALYAYNNANFRDKDWESIGLLNRSLKEKDPLTVGRFGLGFKSVFHITDFPSLIANDAVGFIDPHEKYFKTPEGNKRSCCSLDLSVDREKISRLKHQFQPFSIDLFGISEDTFYQGNYGNQTLFRFPLRRKPSELSSTVFTPDDIYELFKSLESGAFSILLFLNSIEVIEIYDRKNTEKERQIMRINVAEECRLHVRGKRLEFRKRAQQSSHEAVSVSFSVVIEMTKFLNGNMTSKQKQCWAVSLYHAGTEDGRSAIHLMDELKLRPIGGTAVLLYTEEGSIQRRPELQVPSGRIFCFLPLPEEAESPTGLSVHVNAYFALEQNRRHLKWPSSNQDTNRMKELASQWNVFLVENVISKTLINLILYLIQISSCSTKIDASITKALEKCWTSGDKPFHFGHLIYHVMPNTDSLKSWWKLLAKPFYKHLENQCVFYCPQSRWKWANASSKEIIFARYSDELQRPSIDIITKVLRLNGLHLISVPDDVLKAISDHTKVAETLTPSVFSTYFRELQDKGTAFTEDERFDVLDYLCDQVPKDRQLIGLELIPLSNGEWTTFERKQHSSTIYIPTNEHSQKMLPTLDHLFLQRNLTPKRKKTFDKLANTGTFNLALLEPPVVIRLLPEVAGISDCPQQVVQNYSREITYQWLIDVWAYMTYHGVDLCKQAEKCHLVPTDDGARQLATLRRDAPLIAVRTRQMAEICKELGLTAVRDLPSVILRHGMVKGEYILEEDDTSALLKAIKKVPKFENTETLFRSFSQLSDSHKKRLQREFCDSLENGNTNYMVIVRCLPLFRTLPSNDTNQRQWDSADNVKAGTDKFSGEIPLTETVLDLRDHVSRRLAKLLRVNLLTSREIILTYVIPGLKNGKYANVESVAEAIVAKFETILFNDDAFADQVKSVDFIRTASGQFARPAQLYDNHDDALKELFESESLLPAGIFTNVRYRDVLLKLGLRQMDDVANEDLLLVARKLDSQPHSLISSTWKAFIKVLNYLVHKRQNLKFLEELKWLKPVYNRPNSSTGFPESIFLHADSAKPSDVLSSEFSSLVGCIRPLVNTKGMENLAEAFGWNKPPSVKDVVKQLEYIAQWFNEEKQRGFCDLVSLRRLCEDIYDYLEKFLDNDSGGSGDIQSLRDKPCIFIEKCFLKPSRCAFESDLGVDCLPLLCSFAESWTTNYPKFFQCIGVRIRFELDDYLQGLEELHKISKDDDSSEVNKAHVKQALRILSCITVDEKANIDKPVYIPDNTGRMRLASELCFSTTDAEGANVDLCHPSISPRLAKFLGAKSREQYILSSHLEGIEFGQKEELVDRIRRILTGYPMNENILKEMVQNAEDAGASKIHFVVDARHLPSDKVFDERWKPLQRPALCVYNDSPFTEADMIGLRSLGRGAKSSDSSKIGKFGVGFNCVYHLTDTPTLLCHMKNGERRLCAFDPALKSVPYATVASPGYMFTGLDKLKNSYPDVFLGYLENVYGTMGGTVFRFPFRDQASEISDEVVTVKKLRALFEIFKPELYKCLLFMRNIQEISLKEIGDSNEIREIYTVKMHLSDEASRKRKLFNEKYVRATEKRTGVSLDALDTIQTQEIYDFKTEDNEGFCQIWRTVHCMGFELNDIQSLPASLKMANSRGNIDFIPRGDLTLRLSSNQEAKMHYLQRSQQTEGQLFNFLPLPVSLRIPVHVNGCFALDYENRRSLWSESLGGVKSDWNSCLMQKLVAPAYCRLLLEMRPQSEPNEEMTAIRDKIVKFHRLFPDYRSQEPTGTYIAQMITTVYGYIASHDLPLFPVYEKGMRSIKWISLAGRPHFDHLSHIIHEEMISCDESARRPRKVDTMREILVESGFQLVLSNWCMENNFQHAEVEISSTTPECVLEFYKRLELLKMTCKLSETPFKTVEGLCIVLEYIREHVEKEKSLLCLVNSPFLLTEKGLLQVFDVNDLKFLSCYSKLLPHCSDQFIDYRTAEKLGLYMKWPKVAIDAQKRNSDASEKEEIDVCLYKNFGLSDFAEVLPGLLSRTKFSENEFCSIGELSNVFRRSSAVTFWLKAGVLHAHVLKKEKEPAFWWLRQLWGFIAREINADANRAKNDKAKKGTGANCDKERAEPIDVKTDTLDCLKTWCLLPVISSTRKEHLLPISNADAVLVFEEMKDRIDKDLTVILRNIGIPEPNYPVLFGNLSDMQSNKIFLMDYLFHTKQDASVAVVKALRSGDYTGAVFNLQENEKLQMFQFLTCNSHQWTKTEAYVSKTLTSLRRLPIYPSFAGERIAINDSRVHIVPLFVPVTGSRLWTEAHKPTLFLKTIDDTTTAMLTLMGCRQLNLQEVYFKFIFDKFSLLDDEEIYAHMSCFKETVLRKMKKPYPTFLQQLEFLRRANDPVLLRASAFFDPRNPVFYALEDPNNFPPGRYTADEWLDVLAEFFGLVEEVSIEKSLKYAEKFADGFYQIDLNKLRVFIGHIASLEEEPSSKLCCRLKCIPFMPIAQVTDPVANLYCQKGFENDSLSLKMCCFENTVLFKHKNLVWTSHAVLPEFIESIFYSKNNILEKLGVNLLPSAGEVMNHLENVSHAIIFRGGISDRNEHETLKSVLKEIYQFLSESTVQQNSEHNMKELPCIIAEHQNNFILISPNEIVSQIEHEIKPYLYKLPDDFVMFTELLKRWGVADYPTIQHYARVLSTIYSNAEEGRLTSNDQTCFETALRGIFHNLDKQHCSNDFTEIKKLILLGEDGKLYNTSDLFVCDSVTFSDRLQSLDLIYMAEFRSLSLSISSERAADLLRSLPENLRPRFVSECVTEKLSHELQITVEFRDAIELQNKLRGKWFKQGIFRLVKHNTHMSHDMVEVGDNELWSTISALDVIEIKGLERMETYLEYNGEKVSGSERDTLYFFHGKVVYVTDSANDSQDELYAMLAEVINRTCNWMLATVMHCVAPILKCDQRRIDRCLDNLKIRQCDPFPLAFIPTRGEYVPPTMHCFLKQEGWDFKVGKLVAFEISDSIDSDAEIKDEADYIFAEVIEIIKDEEAGSHLCDEVLHRYKINTGEDAMIEVSGKLLYGFCTSEFLPSLPEDIVISSLDMSAQKQKDLEYLDVGNICERIKVILDKRKCYACKATDRRKIIRRLYLEWHPFLNSPSFSEAFQQIIRSIRELYELDKQQSQYFRYYEDRAERLRAQATPQVQKRFGISRTSEPSPPPSPSPTSEIRDNAENRRVQPPSAPVSRSSYPRPEDARRFIRQAKYDFDAAINDNGNETPSYEWACYKYHQAAEKALKAVKFLSSSEQLYIHHLRALLSDVCRNVDTTSIVESVRELEALLPDHSAMRYPGYNRIPHDAFTEETAAEARELANKIVEWAENEIESSRTS